MMKQLIVLLILLTTFSGCKNEKESKKNQKKENTTLDLKEIQDEVVISLVDSIGSLSMNIRTTQHQIKPDLMTIGMEHQNDVVIIPTDSILTVSIPHSYIYSAYGKFKKGDSVLINLKKLYFNKDKIIKYPYFSIVNRDINLYELNFDYYVSLKTPTAKTYRWYKMFSKRKGWKEPSTLEDVYNNILLTANNFYSEKKISKGFYNEVLAEANTLKSNDYLSNAFMGKIPINIDSLITSAQKQPYIKHNFAQNYLVKLLNYKYFLNRKKHAKNSELFETINSRDTLLVPEVKVIILDKLLSNIYSSQRSLFDDYFAKFKRHISDSSSYSNKYRILLSKEEEDKSNNYLLKNDAGKLFSTKSNQSLSLEEIIKSQKGKVVFIDFWASWCAPCRAEIPSLKKLQKEIDSSKFSIISISIDKSINAWKKASEQEKLNIKKHNYLLLDAANSSLVKDLKIYQIPRYLLYNKNGELVNHDAPRPSNGIELNILLEKYLSE